MAFTEKRLAGPVFLNPNVQSNIYLCNTSVVTSTMIKQIIICNLGVSASNFTINLIPQGSTRSSNNILFNNVAIPANETIILNLSQILTSGDVLSYTATNSNTTVTVSGVENQGAMVVSGIADNAVTTAKIANGNVTASKLGPDAFLSNGQAGAIMLMEMM